MTAQEILRERIRAAKIVAAVGEVLERSLASTVNKCRGCALVAQSFADLAAGFATADDDGKPASERGWVGASAASPCPVCGSVAPWCLTRDGVVLCVTKYEAELAPEPRAPETAAEFSRRDWSMSLADACEAINGHYSGASDGMRADVLAEHVEFLQGRLDAWIPTSGSRISAQATYDAAMRELVRAAISLHVSRSAEVGASTGDASQHQAVKCDARDAESGDRCDERIEYVCVCQKCSRTPLDEEKFHACSAHACGAADDAHRRMYGRDGVWQRAQPTPIMSCCGFENGHRDLCHSKPDFRCACGGCGPLLSCREHMRAKERRHFEIYGSHAAWEAVTK